MSFEELEKKMAELDELQAETENAHVKLKAQMAELEKLQAETENAHAKLIAQMAELKERGEEKPEPPHPRWKPKKGEEYWCIHSVPESFTWNDDYFDANWYETGNVFMTEKDARIELERRKLLAEMREWAGNWDDHYVLYYGFEHGKVFAYPTTNVDGALKFRTEEDAYNCIKAVGEERIKKYYFMIPEETNND